MDSMQDMLAALGGVDAEIQRLKQRREAIKARREAIKAQQEALLAQRALAAQQGEQRMTRALTTYLESLAAENAMMTSELNLLQQQDNELDALFAQMGLSGGKKKVAKQSSSKPKKAPAKKSSK